MSREEIEAMPAGLELDKQIALLLGFKPHEGCPGRWLSPDEKISLSEHGLARYSADMSAAWQVVEKMNLLEGADELNAFWWNFWHGTAAHLRKLPASLAALYICRAALISQEPQPGLVEAFAAVAEHFKGVTFDSPALPSPH
jgi:hypothetical protein